MIAILGAMDGEISAFLEHAENIRREEWRGFTFHRGILSGKDTVIARSGVGKVMAALLSQHLIERFQPTHLLFTGLAGSIRRGIEIGDTVVGRECVQHDLDATALGFKRGEIPFTDYHLIPADPQLLDLASTYRPVEGKLALGRILTGDQFMTRAKLIESRYLIDELEGDAVEMEGASVALVAAVNRVPCLVVRTISDKADENAHADFNAFLPQASLNSWRCVAHILQGL